MILCGFLEWVLGNTFPSVGKSSKALVTLLHADLRCKTIVFSTFGAFWLTFAGTLTPSFAAFAYFAAEGQPATTGIASQAFNAGFGKPWSTSPFSEIHG